MPKTNPAAKKLATPLVPHITVHDAAAAIEFYRAAFGAREIARHPAPDGRRIMHAAVEINGAPLMLNDDFPEYCGGKETSARAFGGSPVTLHLNVPNIDAAFARAVKAGATETMPVADQFWGDRYGRMKDPFGHEWSMSTPKFTPTKAEIQKAAVKAFSQGDKKMGTKAKAPASKGKPAAARATASKKRR